MSSCKSYGLLQPFVRGTFWQSALASLSMCLVGVLSACGSLEPTPGTFSTRFSWSTPIPQEMMWAHARVEEAHGAATQVAEAPLALVTETLEIPFSDVPHGGPYRVVVDILGAPDKRSPALYYGESKPFRLSPGRHTEVSVEIALTATPTAAGDRDPSGAVYLQQGRESELANTAQVTLSIAARGATRAVISNDFALRKGRREVLLSELKKDGERYSVDWDLDAGLCVNTPCPDGQRSVFIQFANERGYRSEIVSTRIVLDGAPPALAAFSVTPGFARPGVMAALVVTPTEPLAEGAPPVVSVAPYNPGFGPLTLSPGGAYASSYVVGASAADRTQFTFTIELTDRAGNRNVVTLEDVPFVIDSKAPGLAWGAEVVPAVVRDGGVFDVRFGLDEVAVDLPIVRVGEEPVACQFEGPSRRSVHCTHVATRTEGHGLRDISVEMADFAGNRVALSVGGVFYDTLPRCGDGFVDEGSFELCDRGTANTNAPDGECREDCRPRRCGDAIWDAAHGEACDDGNQVDGDGCTGDCSSNETCGNGKVDRILGETCDDGNLLSHDGCSSDCKLETWQSMRAAARVGLVTRTGAAAYDVARGRVLTFASGSLVQLGDAFSLDVSDYAPDLASEAGPAMTYDERRKTPVLIEWGTTVAQFGVWELAGDYFWKQRTGRGRLQLPVRKEPAMTYVGSRGYTLVFGGYRVDTPYVDTLYDDLWSWDGNYWEELRPQDGVRPTPRTLAAMAYDPMRDRVVVFGGRAMTRVKGHFRNDVWEWDGDRWLEMKPQGPLPALQGAPALAYDPDRQRMVLTDRFLRDVWDWDGERWTPWRDASEPQEEVWDPFDRFYEDRVGLAYDQRLQRMIAVQGTVTATEATSGRNTGAACVLDERGCAPIHDAFASPPARLGQAVAYDARRGRGLIFGGYVPADTAFDPAGQEIYHRDTWLWQGVAGVEVEPAAEAPSARAFAAMAYDAARDVTVLYGGQVGAGQPCDGACSATASLRDTWELQDNRWRRPSVARATPPSGGEMVYDAARRRLTLFAPGERELEVWSWDGATWWKVTLDGDRPRPRTHFAAAYDAARARTVLTGGELFESGALVATDEVWEWDGTRFLPIRVAGPTARSRHALAYHATRGSVILSGGVFRGKNLQDVWEWNGKAWHALPVQSGVADHDAWFDPRSHAMIEVGGYLAGRQPALGPRTLRLEVLSRAEETCLDAEDHDDDGLPGCEDPDCYGRCFSGCNPQLMSCELNLPYCGDGICSDAELCDLCLTDCGACEDRCGNFVCGPGETQASCPGDCTP